MRFQLPNGQTVHTNGHWCDVEDFLDHLTTNLIPDLFESGSNATAEDFQDCVAIIQGLRQPEVSDDNS